MGQDELGHNRSLQCRVSQRILQVEFFGRENSSESGTMSSFVVVLHFVQRFGLEGKLF